jgi:hypothetical protein
MGLTPGSITTLETEQRWNNLSNRPYHAIEIADSQEKLIGRSGRLAIGYLAIGYLDGVSQLVIGQVGMSSQLRQGPL